MNTWHLSDGSKLVLSTHSPEDWAATARMQLLTLGCSVEYADRRAALIRSAALSPAPG